MTFILPAQASISVPTTLSTKTLTIDGNNTTINAPLFRITGTIEVIAIYGVVTTALVNHTNAGWRLNDQTNQSSITEIGTGANLTNFEVGSYIFRSGLAATAMNFSRANQGRLKEPTVLETLEFTEFLLTALPGANTDIEYRYVTNATPSTGAIQFFLQWIARSADATVTPQ